MIEQIRSNTLRKAKRLGYGPLANQLELTKGALWKFCNTEYIPQDPEIRRKLGIPELITIEARRDEKGRFT